MKESIFRRESLEKINSPGQLNRYIRVAEPGMWIMLASVAVLLLGAMIWGVFGSIETKIPVCVSVADGGAVCYINTQDAPDVQPGMELRIGNASGSILAQPQLSSVLPENVDALFAGGEVAAADAQVQGLADGLYEADLILEAIAPISFVVQ